MPPLQGPRRAPDLVSGEEVGDRAKDQAIEGAANASRAANRVQHPMREEAQRGEEGRGPVYAGEWGAVQQWEEAALAAPSDLQRAWEEKDCPGGGREAAWETNT